MFYFKGGLFDYVSGANFLAESIEWTGYAICAWTLPALAFSVFTWVNIAFGRAIHHHQYVKKLKLKFDFIVELCLDSILKNSKMNIQRIEKL